MKASEIQIGDWVIPHVFDSTLEPSKIVGIHYNSYKGKDYVDWVDCEVWDELSLNDIKPIPLTPEILEKNGFDTSDPEVKQYHFTEGGQRYHFSLRQMYSQKDNKPNGYSFYAFSVLTIIDYVHQLQHALKLCGIDKEIIL